MLDNDIDDDELFTINDDKESPGEINAALTMALDAVRDYEKLTVSERDRRLNEFIILHNVALQMWKSG